MDELERFISHNREAFDDRRPDKIKMWEKIEQQLPQTPRAKRFSLVNRFMRIAASLLLLALLGSVLFIQSKSDRSTNMIAEQEELQDINSYYNQLIDYKVRQVKTSVALSEADKREFLDYFKELETECEALEKDLALQFDNEQVLSAIVENYRQRLNLLENLLRRLNQTKVKNDEKSILL